MNTGVKYYRSLRQEIGSRVHVAWLLGIAPKTLYRRETNRTAINEEMVLAMAMLKINHEKKSPLVHLRD